MCDLLLPDRILYFLSTMLNYLFSNTYSRVNFVPSYHRERS
jgi:hypothetical protein